MIDYSRIPESTIETLTAWIESGRPMGHFCSAVVSNDLQEACARADEQNARALFDIVAWLHNHAPIGSWGSPEVLKTWPKRAEMNFLPPDHPDAPKYWVDETGGELAPAVQLYLAGGRLTARQIDLMKAYLWQWVKSPVWAPSGILEALRLRVAAIQTQNELSESIHRAIELGMDPL